MDRRTLLTVLTAAMLVLAGCAGSGGDSSPTNTTATPGDDIDPEDGTDTDDGTTGSATGTVEFYVSDDPGQIDDFRHLNVTITQIGFERAGPNDGGENETENGTETENETEDETGTEQVEDPDSDDNETTTESGGHGEEGEDAHDSEETEANDDTETDDESDGDDGEESEGDDEESEGENGDESEDEESEDDRGGWVTHDVDSRTVDLTQLRGDNATLVGSPEIPAGNYSKVFVHVSDINATLADGSSANVKLPSEKLQLNKGFELEPNGSVSFVYDISVFKAGNSGKYILKPVISESGPDRNVEEVDDEERDGEEDEREDSEGDTDGTTETEAGEEEAADGDGPPEDRGQN